ncbi:MAG: 23S rRNA (uracil(1939)-C(5))-methyltransferase RlmD [Cytophagaceae bacterium]|nr:23S rRNA (uracil(1939)-C(5))-methyltransferase RlmD [Cytophagaceae bacterium]MDW8456638.1 23S rRNA (uracil(1939)-C(5))-methyltransferase RlmD [Cytophagaceae bacterium]
MKHKEEIIYEVPIDDLVAEGKCISKVNGKIIFTEYTAPGDVVDIKIKKSKKNYSEAEVIYYHKYSEERVHPFCSHFSICGGCKLQHINYAAQLKYKARQVSDHLTRIGNVSAEKVYPILPSEQIQYYRNKLEYTFSSRRWLTKEEIASNEPISKYALGFHVPGMFDRVIDIKHCYLQPGISNALRNEIKEYTLQKGWEYFDAKTQKGFLRSLMIRTTEEGQTMVLLQFFENRKKEIEELLQHIKQTFPHITSLLYVINPKGNDTIYDQQVHLYYGKEYITERIAHLHFRIGPKSFFQTNTRQTAMLYKKALELAALEGNETLYDLYTGTGTIALFAAGLVKKVIGIEYISQSIEDARKNAEANHICNALFFTGDIKEVLTENFLQEHGTPDVIITDPPRAGMHTDVTQKLLDIAAEKIVYISCNPATQARDIALLSSKYKLSAIQPVDMFPHTHHVENIALLTLR